MIKAQLVSLAKLKLKLKLKLKRKLGFVMLAN